MKYIRTKDGKIIRILKEEIDEFGKYGMVDEENCIRNYDDLNQADTIEELIDEYVIWKEGNKPLSIPAERKDLINTANVVTAICKHVKCWLRGAIWTDKGLIYVAKMNEKGELELL